MTVETAGEIGIESASLDRDLIVAVATAPGQGGIGIVRLSGKGAANLAKDICSQPLQPRQAVFCQFSVPPQHVEKDPLGRAEQSSASYLEDNLDLIDEGIVLWYPDGQSFTGEEVVEFQSHGSPVVLQRLVSTCCDHGARLARPGEFSERAYLNGKIDLAQAEAIADLISSSSVAAAKAAVRSLRGDFSRAIYQMSEQLERLRIFVEACIDFPEEDVEQMQNAKILENVIEIQNQLREILGKSQQGVLMNEGATIALVGPPNAGKSSLLNTLVGEEAAIVTDIPGTTRDLLKVDLVLDGVPINIVDSAGIRPSTDIVETLGIERAVKQAHTADLILLMLDVEHLDIDSINELRKSIQDETDPHDLNILVVVNKMDLLEEDIEDPAQVKITPKDADIQPNIHKYASAFENLRDHWLVDYPYNYISAKFGNGVDQLRREILQILGRNQNEVPYTARARHIEALLNALQYLETAQITLQAGVSSELVAEELRLAHLTLGEIVGITTPDDLLGRIFSEFCIGK